MISSSIPFHIIHNWRPLDSITCLIPQGFSKASFQIVSSLLFLQQVSSLASYADTWLGTLTAKKKCSLPLLPHIHLFFFFPTDERITSLQQWDWCDEGVISFFLAKDNHVLQNLNIHYDWKCPVFCSLAWERNMQPVQGSNTAESCYLSFSLTNLRQNQKRDVRINGESLKKYQCYHTYFCTLFFSSFFVWNDWQTYDAARRRRPMAVPAVPNQRTLTALVWLTLCTPLCTYPYSLLSHRPYSAC